MNINNWIEESHYIALSKGWYDCYYCNGKGTEVRQATHADDGTVVIDYHGNPIKEFVQCEYCNGTGKKDRDISEMISLTIEELYEAQRAHRAGDFSKKENVEFYIEKLCKELQPETPTSIGFFELNIKDKFEDECADVLIRLFDMMGYCGLKYDTDFALIVSITLEETFSKNMLIFNEMLFDVDRGDDFCTEFIVYFLYFCEQQNVDIETHINLKMEYNRTREYKHGKRY